MVSSDNQRYEVNLGNNLNLSCMAEGMPTPDISWRFLPNWNKTFYKQQTARVVGPYMSKSVLSLQNIQEDAIGEYECSAHSMQGKTTVNITGELKRNI